MWCPLNANCTFVRYLGNTKLFYILNASGLCASSGEGRRQIQGGAVRLDGEKITDVNLSFEQPEQLSGKILQVGKKKFIKLVKD